jgi:(p)ppGpp synthase/HD superfamily hydrolase
MDVPVVTESAVGNALRELALKDMDPSLLAFAILREADASGLDARDVARMRAAMEVAAYVHRDDFRSSRKQLPVDLYITHPFRLVLRLLRYGCRDVAMLCAATLHDTVEDHPDDIVALLGAASGGANDALGILAAAFGEDVAGIVAAVTNPRLPEDMPPEERRRAYAEHVTAAIADPRVFMVKLADLVDNAGSLRHLDDPERRSRLELRYSPLIPALRVAFGIHRESLDLGAVGLAAIEDHLAGIARQLTSHPYERNV